MFWDPRGRDRLIATRGTEWFVFDPAGRITEIRSYHGQLDDRDTELRRSPTASADTPGTAANTAPIHIGFREERR